VEVSEQVFPYFSVLAQIFTWHSLPFVFAIINAPSLAGPPRWVGRLRRTAWSGPKMENVIKCLSQGQRRASTSAVEPRFATFDYYFGV